MEITQGLSRKWETGPGVAHANRQRACCKQEAEVHRNQPGGRGSGSNDTLLLFERSPCAAPSYKIKADGRAGQLRKHEWRRTPASAGVLFVFRWTNGGRKSKLTDKGYQLRFSLLHKIVSSLNDTHYNGMSYFWCMWIWQIWVIFGGNPKLLSWPSLICP